MITLSYIDYDEALAIYSKTVEKSGGGMAGVVFHNVMEWMITHEYERVEMGKNARLTASRYKKEFVMKEWERAYQSVLK